MRIKKLLLPSLVCGAAAALAVKALSNQFAKGLNASRPGSSEPTFAQIDAFLEGQMRSLNIPGAALAIIEGDQIVHLRGFGRTHPGGETPAPQTPFFIGSLTKSFTALAVMQLVEKGKVDLDAPVQRYLPWFQVADPRAYAQMTVRHLLNQTSGLPMLPGLANLANFDCGPGAVERQARALSTLRLVRPPDAGFEYSNLNYNLLGLVIEAASGESYTSYIQQHIFDPLGMSHSYSSQAAAQPDGLAVGHRYWFGIPVAAPGLPVPAGSLPSGQLISSAEDMARYLLLYLNGGRCGKAHIISPESITEMHHPAVEIREMGESFGFYGMGWISEGTGRARIVSHSGIVPHFGAFMALLPEQNKGLVLLFNANHAAMKMTFDELGMRTARLLAGLPALPTRYGAAPWLLRGLLLVPAFQIVDVVCTLKTIYRWQRGLQPRPSCGRMWQQHILLPLIPHLCAILALVPALGELRGFLKLFAPDFSWTARICGGFAGGWIFLRTWLLFQARRKPAPVSRNT